MFKHVNMCKQGWCVGEEQDGVCLNKGDGNCLKHTKRGWNRKEGRGNKDFKEAASWVNGIVS